MDAIAISGRKSKPKVRRNATLNPSGGYHATIPGRI
jgi:hypothetical protein